MVVGYVCLLFERLYCSAVLFCGVYLLLDLWFVCGLLFAVWVLRVLTRLVCVICFKFVDDLFLFLFMWFLTLGDEVWYLRIICVDVYVVCLLLRVIAFSCCFGVFGRLGGCLFGLMMLMIYWLLICCFVIGLDLSGYCWCVCWFILLRLLVRGMFVNYVTLVISCVWWNCCVVLALFWFIWFVLRFCD